MELGNTITIVTVFGHSDRIAREWVECHLKIVPEDITVYLVENLVLPDPKVTLLLWKGCRERRNWVLLSSLRHLVPYRYISHGECLDTAIKFVRTPYVLVLDSDAFIQKWSVIEEMVKVAQRENAAIVGHLMDYNITLPYIHPFCALYRVDCVRRFGMKERHYYPTLPPEYMKYWRDNPNDVYKEVRKHYLDIGQKVYYDVINEGGKTVNFPVFEGVIHLWGATPFLWMWAWNNDYSIRIGRDKGRPFHL